MPHCQSLGTQSYQFGFENDRFGEFLERAMVKNKQLKMEIFGNMWFYFQVRKIGLQQMNHTLYFSYSNRTKVELVMGKCIFNISVNQEMA